MLGNTVRLQINACVKAVREGLDDSELMTRFGVSKNQLADLFGRLVQGGHLFPDELEARAAYLSQSKNRLSVIDARDKSSDDSTKPESDQASTTEGGIGGAVRNKRIFPKDIRVHGEIASLYVTLASMAFVLLFLVRSSFGTVMIFLLIIAAVIKVKQGQLLGNSVRTSQHQLSELHEVATGAAQCLDMDFQDFFVIQDPVINAYALGFLGKKSVVLHSATVEAMTPEELKFIVGHELTHIKCHHTLWTALANVKGAVHVPVVADLLGFIMLHWSRKAEYTADRGGLIASHDLVYAVSALAKLTVGKELFKKMNLDHLLHQLHELDQDGLTKLTELFASHPYTVRRIRALKAFYESDAYSDLLSATRTPTVSRKPIATSKEVEAAFTEKASEVRVDTSVPVTWSIGRVILAVFSGIGLTIMWLAVGVLIGDVGGSGVGFTLWLLLTLVGLVCTLLRLKKNRTRDETC